MTTCCKDMMMGKQKQKGLFDKHAEVALIGAGFLDSSIFTDDINPEDFGIPGYGLLWAACRKLAREGITPDLITLPLDTLPSGMNPIDFINLCPSAVRSVEYATIVKRWSRRRKLENAASAFAQAAYENEPAERMVFMQQAHNLLTESRTDNSYRSWSLGDLLDDETPIPVDIIEGFIPGKSAVLFSGPGGDGKSFAMLDLAICVARGVPWLGIDASRSSVLIIDLENRMVRVRERMRTVMKGHSLVIPPPITFAFDLDLRLDCDEVVLEITHLVKQCNAGLVILDSLVDFLGDVDENSNPEMGKVASRLRAICEDANVSVLAIHHTPKNNGMTPRGATALRNGTDVNILVSRDGNTFVMRQDKNRSGPEVTVAARLNWDDGLFNLSPVGVSVGRAKRTPDPDEAAILDALETGIWTESKAIVEHAMGITKHHRSTIHRKLGGMIKDGVLEKDTNQGKGKPYLVCLLDTGIPGDVGD